MAGVVEPLAAEEGGKEGPAFEIELTVEAGVDGFFEILVEHDAGEGFLVPEGVLILQGFFEAGGDGIVGMVHEDAAVHLVGEFVVHATEFAGGDDGEGGSIFGDEDIGIEEDDLIVVPPPIAFGEQELLPGVFFAGEFADGFGENFQIVTVAGTVSFEAGSGVFIEDGLVGFANHDTHHARFCLRTHEPLRDLNRRDLNCAIRLEMLTTLFCIAERIHGVSGTSEKLRIAVIADTPDWVARSMALRRSAK